MNTSKVVLGTMAGIAAGGILGILFAPEKGSVTRKKIAEKGNDCLDDLKSKCSDLADTLKENFQNAKNEAKDLAENGIENFKRVEKNLNDEAKNF
jgi:gas vesicle protein